MPALVTPPAPPGTEWMYQAFDRTSGLAAVVLGIGVAQVVLFALWRGAEDHYPGGLWGLLADLRERRNALLDRTVGRAFPPPPPSVTGGARHAYWRWRYRAEAGALVPAEGLSEVPGEVNDQYGSRATRRQRYARACAVPLARLEIAQARARAAGFDPMELPDDGAAAAHRAAVDAAAGDLARVLAEVDAMLPWDDDPILRMPYHRADWYLRWWGLVGARMVPDGGGAPQLVLDGLPEVTLAADAPERVHPRSGPESRFLTLCERGREEVVRRLDGEAAGGAPAARPGLPHGLAEPWRGPAHEHPRILAARCSEATEAVP